MFIFKGYKKHVPNFLRPIPVYTVNVVFQLHYRLTVWILAACCLLVSSKEFIKDHINCLSGVSQAKVVNQFCFVSTTFTVFKLHNQSQVYNHISQHGAAASFPGVGPYTGVEEIVRHSYYQWVPFILFFQAVMFYAPRKLWKAWDNKRLYGIVHRITPSRAINAKQWKCAGKYNKLEINSAEELCHKHLNHLTFKINRSWAIHMVICEILNALNILFQIWVTNAFLRGCFYGLGPKWLEGDKDYIDFVFPKVTKCIFHKFGPTGTIQNYDTLCVMSLNIVNEKIYVILWFWFFGLSILTVLAVLWRLISMCLHRNTNFNKRVWSTLSPGLPLASKDIQILSKELCFCDWLLFYYIGRNTNEQLFRVAMSQLAKNISRLKPNRLIQLEHSNDDLAKESYC